MSKRLKFPEREMCNHVQGLNGNGMICFEGRVRINARSEREVGIMVSQDMIKVLAKILEHTDSPGHAVWHLQNPEREFPCSSCGFENPHPSPLLAPVASLRFCPQCGEEHQDYPDQCLTATRLFHAMYCPQTAGAHHVPGCKLEAMANYLSSEKNFTRWFLQGVELPEAEDADPA